MPNDVYFKVGLITIIGLSAKNAILIIEFAKDLQAQGKGADRGGAGGGAPALPADPDDLAGLHPGRAAAGRSRRGAGSASQRAIGTGVMGGMITATAAGACSSCRCSSSWCAASSRAASASASWYAHEPATPPAARADARRPAMSRRVSLARARRCAARARAGRLLDRDPDLRAARRAGAGDLSGRADAGGRRRDGRRRHRLAALLRRPAPEAADRAGAGEQPRPARRGAQHRAGARAVPDPPRRPAARRVGVGAQRARASPAPAAASRNVYTVGLAVTGYELDFFGRVAQPERRGAGAVPGDRGGAQGGADQPGRRRWPTPT